MKEIQKLVKDLYLYEILDKLNANNKNAHALVNPSSNIPDNLKDSLVLLMGIRETKDSVTHILAGYKKNENGDFYDISYIISGDNLPSLDEIVNSCKPIDIKEEWTLTPSIFKGWYFRENNIWKNYQNAPLIKRSYLYFKVNKKYNRFINFFEENDIPKQTDSIYTKKRINKSICLFIKSHL